MIQSMTRRKKKRERKQPWLTIVLTWKLSFEVLLKILMSYQ